MSSSTENKNKTKSSLGRYIKVSLKLVALVALITVFSLTIGQFLTRDIETKLIDLGRSRNVENHHYFAQILTKEDVFGTSVSSPTLAATNNVNTWSGITTTDPRVIALRQFLIDYNSPLYPYAEVFVSEADKYDLDWRLVVSISGVESAFGNLIPYQSNNGWGWKGDPTRDWSYFPSWTVGIKTVTERIALGYGTTLTPFDMEATYCPPCGRNPAHAWANGVTNFMNELDLYVENLE